jgi:hypothetical protein
MKMYAYTSNEPNEEDGMPEARLKISKFEIFKCKQIKLDHLISLHLLKKTTLNKWGIHQNLKKIFSNWRFSARPILKPPWVFKSGNLFCNVIAHGKFMGITSHILQRIQIVIIGIPYPQIFSCENFYDKSYSSSII